MSSESHDMPLCERKGLGQNRGFRRNPFFPLEPRPSAFSSTRCAETNPHLGPNPGRVTAPLFEVPHAISLATDGTRNGLRSRGTISVWGIIRCHWRLGEDPPPLNSRLDSSLGEVRKVLSATAWKTWWSLVAVTSYDRKTRVRPSWNRPLAAGGNTHSKPIWKSGLACWVLLAAEHK